MPHDPGVETEIEDTDAVGAFVSERLGMYGLDGRIRERHVDTACDLGTALELVGSANPDFVREDVVPSELQVPSTMWTSVRTGGGLAARDIRARCEPPRACSSRYSCRGSRPPRCSQRKRGEADAVEVVYDSDAEGLVERLLQHYLSEGYDCPCYPGPEAT